MAKTKGIVSKGEQSLRDQYQAYFLNKKWGTKTKSGKKTLKEDTDTYYDWKKSKTAKPKPKASSRTKTVSKQTGLTKKELERLR